MRNHVFKMLKIMTVVLLGWMTCVRLFNIRKGFSEQALYITNYASLSVSLMLTVLLIRLKLSLVDYALFIILAVRCVTVFLIMHLIDVSAPGFELIEKKDLNLAIPFVAMPAQILGICNLRLNYLVILPLTNLSVILVNRYAFTTDSDNLSCYSNPEGKAGALSSSWIVLILMMVIVCYMYRRSTLENFIEQEKSKKQQE